VDTIRNFVPGQDVIKLTAGDFAGLGQGVLPATAFFTGSSAHDGDDRIVYDPALGDLYFDPDGSGPAAAVRFVHLQPGLDLSSGDFLIF